MVMSVGHSRVSWSQLIDAWLVFVGFFLSFSCFFVSLGVYLLDPAWKLADLFIRIIVSYSPLPFPPGFIALDLHCTSHSPCSDHALDKCCLISNPHTVHPHSLLLYILCS